MEHFARWVVKRRKLILVLAVLLLIPSVFGALGTYINYDILTYLPKDLDSMIGETYLEDDFNMASVSMITVENMSTPDTLKLKSDLEGVEGVQKVMWTSDFIDVTTPKEMLPSDIQKFFYNDSGATMLIVQFDAPSADARTMNAQKQIKNILNKDCFIGGMSAILEDTKSLINKEMPLYILCAVGASLLILFLSLKETIVPLIFMLGMLFPIVYNFGTNIFLGQISYITEAFATGVGTLDAGTNQLLSGMETLSSSSKTVSNAIGQFQTGGAELKDGTSELSDGMTEFSGTINDKLDGLSEITDPDSTLARVIDIMKDRADSFKGSGRADGTDMTVSYVMRTATDSSSNSTSTTEETTTETETKDSFWNRVANLFSK